MGELALRMTLVAVGGAAGACSRYGLNGLAQAAMGPRLVPLGTLAANVLGCFLAGVLLVLLTDRPVLSHHQRLLLLTGFLGGMTTFSSFGLETLELALARQWGRAGLNVGLNLVLSLAGVWGGWAAARSVWAGHT